MLNKKTKKLFIMLLAAAAVFIMSVIVTPAVEAAPPEELQLLRATNASIVLNGKGMTGVDSILIEGTTWVSIRSFCEEMGAAVSWEGKTRTATVKGKGLELIATDGSEYICANGRYLYTGDAAKIFSNGKMYVPVRLLAKAFGLEVEWNNQTLSVILTSTTGPIQGADSFYDYSSIYWLSRIIFAESGAEPLLGQIAVGNVVLNRLALDSYPDTIYQVIFDDRFAVQFSPTASGTIYKVPSDKSVIAAKICLEGYSVSSDIVYFYEPTLATSTWIRDNCNYEFTIGCHRFYS